MKTKLQRLSIRTFLVSLFLAILFLSSCGHHDRNLQVIRSTTPVRMDGTLDFVRSDGFAKASIFIEIADAPDTWKKGLMGRQNLDFKHGMLFVFDQITPRKFWMKNTPVPLDIIFVGRDKCIVNITESATPMSDRHYSSNGPIKYAVEVKAGFARRFKIGEGTCIRWRRR